MNSIQMSVLGCSWRVDIDLTLCTLSDRAAANHAAFRLVNEAFGKTLIEVNCHLHPLDTIATRCRTALRSLETEKSKLFRNCSEKIVLANNKMRFKDGKGAPAASEFSRETIICHNH